MLTKVNCPTCNQQVLWLNTSEYRPFCSKKCQLIDLGEWSDENHTISSPLNSEQILTPEAIENVEALFANNQQDFFKN